MKDRKEYWRTYYQTHKAEHKTFMKSWQKKHREEWYRYQKSDVNSSGKSKHSIRVKSNYYLKKSGLKITGYEIHHCFGYEDASKFIYISKALHLKIHQYLRDNNISADIDHWMYIRDIVNSSDDFVYIKC